MSQDRGSGKGRRGFSVDGAEATTTRAPKTRSIDDALRLDRDEAPALRDGQTAYNPERVRAFVAGRITLGDLEGITKQEQYQMAEVGHSYLTSGKLGEAKIVFEGLLALDPFDAYFHMALGAIAQRDGNLSEAEDRYSRALQINPFSASAMANRGEVRVMLGRFSEGAEDLIRAVQADPQGQEPSTVRAQSTLNVLREQLSAAAAQGSPSADDPVPDGASARSGTAARGNIRPTGGLGAGRPSPGPRGPTANRRRRPAPRKK